MNYLVFFLAIKSNITLFSVKRDCDPYFSLNEGICREPVLLRYLSCVNTINKCNFHKCFNFPEDPKWRVDLQQFWISPAGFSWPLSFCSAQSLLSLTHSHTDMFRRTVCFSSCFLWDMWLDSNLSGISVERSLCECDSNILSIMTVKPVKPLHLRGTISASKITSAGNGKRVIVQAYLSVSTTCLVRMVSVKWTMSGCVLASIMDIKPAAFIPLKSNVLLSFTCVGASCIIKSPSGCRLKKNLLSANEIDTSPVQGHCSWFAPAWKWAPRYFMGQCSAHNIAWKASRCHCNWITFPLILSLNAAVIYKIKYKCWSHPCVLILQPVSGNLEV